MTKDLFTKYLQGDCTEEEFEQILVWIREESQSISGKEVVQKIWQEFEPEAGPVERIKYNRLLDKIHHQININQNPKTVVTQKTSAKNRVLTILTRVAAILLLPVLGLLLYTNLPDNDRYAANINELEVEAPAGSRMHIELGDGTKVFLNHGSKLRYPYRFDGDVRKVFLTGEAYFEVAHNAKIPFIVGTNRLDVKATGTAFNVSAYPDDDLVEATLVEGKVILYERKSNSEIKALTPGECLKFDIQKNSYSVETGNTLKYTAWKDGLLVFKNDSVADIAKKLARWYNIDVEITNEKIKEYPFTATFTDETLPQVLELLSLATPASYQLTLSKKLPDGSFSKQKVLIGLKTKDIKR
jgi:ferric-dicitrate binding protein FerR (iron transport regulator)